MWRSWPVTSLLLFLFRNCWSLCGPESYSGAAISAVTLAYGALATFMMIEVALPSHVMRWRGTKICRPTRKAVWTGNLEKFCILKMIETYFLNSGQCNCKNFFALFGIVFVYCFTFKGKRCHQQLYSCQPRYSKRAKLTVWQAINFLQAVFVISASCTTYADLPFLYVALTLANRSIQIWSPPEQSRGTKPSNDYRYGCRVMAG